jgi:hypothetical protein
MNAIPVRTEPLTKDERYEIKRLAERVRGLYRSEKQALAFIAEAQTMQNGVCSKALKRAEDFGYERTAIQRGIHGKRRNGKLEYPGLLSRGIAYVAGGYPKGGLAPGGQGLTPEYAINRAVLLTFIPDTDDPPEKGDTLGDTLGDTSPKKGETKVCTNPCTKVGTLPIRVCTKVDQGPTSSLSSSPASSPKAPQGGAFAVAPAGTAAAVFAARGTEGATQTQHLEKVNKTKEVAYGDREAARFTDFPLYPLSGNDAIAASGLKTSGHEKRSNQSGALKDTLPKIAARVLQNACRAPKNLKFKLELIAEAYGAVAVAEDFEAWCIEHRSDQLKYPIIDYVKAVDARLGPTPSEKQANPADPDVEPIRSMAYETMGTLPPVKAVAKLLLTYSPGEITGALTEYAENLTEPDSRGATQAFFSSGGAGAIILARRRRVARACNGN